MGDVKAAYRRISMLVHPDRNLPEDRDRANQAFQILNNANEEAAAVINGGGTGGEPNDEGELGDDEELSDAEESNVEEELGDDEELSDAEELSDEEEELTVR